MLTLLDITLEYRVGNVEYEIVDFVAVPIDRSILIPGHIYVMPTADDYLEFMVKEDMSLCKRSGIVPYQEATEWIPLNPTVD